MDFIGILERIAGRSVDDHRRRGRVELITANRAAAAPEEHSQRKGDDCREDEFCPRAHSGEDRVVKRILPHLE